MKDYLVRSDGENHRIKAEGLAESPDSLRFYNGEEKVAHFHTWDWWKIVTVKPRPVRKG